MFPLSKGGAARFTRASSGDPRRAGAAECLVVTGADTTSAALVSWRDTDALARPPLNGVSLNEIAMTQPAQKISDLTSEDLARLADQRALIEAYLADDSSREKYKTTAGKLGLLRALLEAQVFAANQTFELQSMGVVLGDALVQELGLHWVTVEDEYGRDPALAVPGKTLLLYPLTMISKRVEAGKAVDVFDLFNWTAGQIEELK